MDEDVDNAERALLLVEPKHARVNFEKKRLSKVLGLPLIADHGESHPEYSPPIAVEQQKESFLIPLGHFAAERFVRERSKLFRTTRSIPESHLYLSQRFPLSSEGFDRAVSERTSASAITTPITLGTQNTTDSSKIKVLSELSKQKNVAA